MFGWASSGGTAVPGLRPTMPALVVGVRGRSMLCGRATQDKTMLRGDKIRKCNCRMPRIRSKVREEKGKQGTLA